MQNFMQESLPVRMCKCVYISVASYEIVFQQSNNYSTKDSTWMMMMMMMI